jgi:hypothetical protein
MEALDLERQQRRKVAADDLAAPMTSFSYMTRDGKTEISTSPDLYKQLPLWAQGVIMTFNMTLIPTANITLTLRSRPYVFLELAVAGANRGLGNYNISSPG